MLQDEVMATQKRRSSTGTDRVPRVLLDITHPAHFHFFRPAMEIMAGKGYEVVLAARDKDLTLPLLDSHGYNYVVLSRARNGLGGLAREMVEHEGRLLQLMRRIRPHVVAEIAGTFIVHAALVARVPSLVFYDTEAARLSNHITYPFATRVITPDCYQGNAGKKHIRYTGYQELAYLHPAHFKPDLAVLSALGIGADERYFVVRFVTWQASHDVGERGFSVQDKLELVRRLREHGKVFITSETALPETLEENRLRLPPHLVHHLLAFADMYVGESATMASEAALLGTPSLYVSTSFRGYISDQQARYQISHWCPEPGKALEMAVSLATDLRAKERWAKKRARMLSDMEDVTGVVVQLLEEYAGVA